MWMRAFVEIALAARELNLLVVIEDEDAVAQRPVHGDFEIGVGAFDGAKIAAVLIGRHSARPVHLG